MDTATFLKQIDKLPGYQGQVVHVERLKARRAHYGNLDRPLPPALQSALHDTGAARLYAHQAEAINAVRTGQHVILSTGTASGKTLAYNLPVLEAILADRGARALYLFPTKALARLVQAGVWSIAFTRARRVAELILLYARRILEDRAPALADRPRAYRAGYRPEERRGDAGRIASPSHPLSQGPCPP